MKNIWLLTKYTIREAFSKKIFLAFTGISTFVLLVFAGLFIFLGLEDFMPMVKQGGQEMDLIGEVVGVLKSIVIVPLFGGGIFLSIFAVSSFIPSLLEKGNVDLFLSKPISRPQIILGKFFGGVLVVLANIFYLVFGLYLLLGLKFGNWELYAFNAVIITTFTFASLYAMIIFIGIITRSSVLAMMVSYVIFFMLSPMLVAREEIYILLDSTLIEYLIEGLYYFIPKTTELGKMAFELSELGKKVMTSNDPFSWQPILTTFGFMILNLAGSIFIFNKKDY